MSAIPPNSLRGRAAEFLKRPSVFMLLTWLAQLVLMLALFFFLGPNTPHGRVTLEMPVDRLLEVFGFSDPGSSLQAAQNLIANGTSTPEWEWVLNLWPPGMVWLDAAILYASPLPFGVSIALVSSLVWSLTFAVLAWPFVRTTKGAIITVVVELAVLATSPFQSWMFDEWPFYADGFAVASFLLGVGILVNRVRRPGDRLVWVRDGIFAGIAFAFTIYMRSSYQLVPWMLAAIGVVLVVVIVLRRRRGRDYASPLRQLLFVGTATATILLLLAPYAAYTYKQDGRLAFVATEDLVYEHVWQDPKTDDLPQWMIDGGSSLGCDLDQATCDRVHEQIAAGNAPTPDQLRGLLISAVVANPGEFVANRVYYVLSQWFADERDSYTHKPGDYTPGQDTYTMSPNLNVPQNLLYLGFLITAVACSLVLVRRGEWLLLFIPGSVLAVLAPLAVVHVEVRYLIPLKLLALLVPVLLLVLRERAADAARPPGSSNQ